MSPKLRWFLLLTPLLFGFDFWTKHEVTQHIGPRDEVVLVDGLLSFVHAENPGAAFSMAIPQAIILAFAAVALGLLAHMLWTLPRTDRLQAAALAFLVSGIVGNAVDRMADGTVTDFIRVYTEHPAARAWLVERFGTATWPIFNIADIAICSAMGLFLLARVVEPDAPDDAEDLSPSPG